jgi:hypothetical protein
MHTKSMELMRYCNALSALWSLMEDSEDAASMRMFSTTVMRYDLWIPLIIVDS